MFSTVRGVPAAPPVTGLMAAADRPPDDPNTRWEDGFGWIPERCGASYQLIPWCVGTLDPYNPDTPTAVYYRPPAMRIARQCSTLGGELDTEALRRIADATTPYAIARELWTGEISAEDSWTLSGSTHTNAALASADAVVVITPATEFVQQLAALESAAAQANRGQQIMIHLPVILSGRLMTYVDKVGTTLVTRAGNLVVVDAGYPGTGPTGQTVGASAWAYASSKVQVRLSPWQIITDPAQTVDRATNTVTAWAERVFAAAFDPCSLFAIEINL